MKIRILHILVIILSASCVSTSKYIELNKEKEQCSEERTILKAENEELTVENTELKAFKENADITLGKIAEDSIRLKNEIAELEQRYTNLQNSYNNLKESQETLLKGSARETTRLLKQLQVSQDDLQSREDELIRLGQEVETKKRSLENARYELEKRNARLVELENILFRKDSAVNALKQKVQAALLGFADEGLTVVQKNGKVYVSLEEKLLFGSGSTEVDAKGQRAIQRLAKVLEQNPDINIMIEGHTDDVEVIPSKNMQDNWDLSVLRGTAIVRILLDNSTIDPLRLTVAGRGEFSPLERAKTPEARQKNRRTEIILTPKLDELFEILNSH